MKRLELPRDGIDAWSLARLELDREETERRLGPPQRESARPRPEAADAGERWAFGFECGLEVVLTMRREGGGPLVWSLTGNLPEAQHALEHLGLEAASVTWRGERVRAAKGAGGGEPGEYQLWRQDDGGNRFLVDRLASARTAACVLEMFEARGHKQTYFVIAREIARLASR